MGPRERPLQKEKTAGQKQDAGEVQPQGLKLNGGRGVSRQATHLDSENVLDNGRYGVDERVAQDARQYGPGSDVHPGEDRAECEGAGYLPGHHVEQREQQCGYDDGLPDRVLEEEPAQDEPPKQAFLGQGCHHDHGQNRGPRASLCAGKGKEDLQDRFGYRQYGSKCVVGLGYQNARPQNGQDKWGVESGGRGR